jgi:hypothetical protein
MPLSSLERAKVRHYLGYGVLFISEDPDSSKLESAMDVLDTRTDSLTLVQSPLVSSPPGILARLDDLEQKLLQSHNRRKASEVGSIVLNTRELLDLRDEQNRARLDLARILGVMPMPASNSYGGNYVGV